MLSTTSTTALIPRRAPACTILHLLPALASVAISVTGIAVALIYKNPYLTIPPAVGLFISFYYIAVTLHVRKLKSFQENNIEFKSEVSSLRTENGKLHDEVEKFALENKKHEEHVLSLVKVTKAVTGSLEVMEKYTATQKELTENSFAKWESNLTRSEECQKAGEALELKIRETFERFFSEETVKEKKKELKKLKNLIQRHEGAVALLEEQVGKLKATQEEFGEERLKLKEQVDRLLKVDEEPESEIDELEADI